MEKVFESWKDELAWSYLFGYVEWNEFIKEINKHKVKHV
jgi:hypothetical protein